jgi:hypothetical protein
VKGSIWKYGRRLAFLSLAAVLLFFGAALLRSIYEMWTTIDDERARITVEDGGNLPSPPSPSRVPKEPILVNRIHLDMRVNRNCTIDVTEIVEVTIVPGGERRYSRKIDGKGYGGPNGKGWSESGLPDWYPIRRFTIKDLAGERDGIPIDTHQHEYDDLHTEITICAEPPASGTSSKHTYTLRYTSTGNFMRHYIWFLNRHHRLQFWGIKNRYGAPIEHASIRVTFPEGTRIPDTIRPMGAAQSIIRETPNTILFESKGSIRNGESMGFDLSFSKLWFSYFLIWLDVIYIPIYGMAYFAITESAKALYRRFRVTKVGISSATE